MSRPGRMLADTGAPKIRAFLSGFDTLSEMKNVAIWREEQGINPASLKTRYYAFSASLKEESAK